MLKAGKIYERSEWKRETKEGATFGIQKDILKDRFAPQLDYADFMMGESKDGKWIYCMTMISEGIFGKRKVKVVGVLTKEEYNTV